MSLNMGSNLRDKPKSGLFGRLFDRLKGQTLCLLGKHEPARNKVVRKGIFFTGHCHRCGIPIAKRNGRP